MHRFSEADLLRVWELGQHRLAWQRALLMLAPMFPAASQGWLANLSLGQRNAYLFLLRAQLLGPTLQALAACPHCQTGVEFSAQVADICPNEPELDAAGVRAALIEGVEVAFRRLNSYDLAAVDSQDLESARAALVRRAIVRVGGGALSEDGLPHTLIAAIGEQIREADPLAELRIQLACPACGLAWLAAFDIAAFLWTELSHLAGRLINEVHALASAYGWREPDILSMSARRRRAYLDLVGV